MKTPKIMNNVPKMMRSAILAALAIAATACSNDLPDASDKNTPDTPNGKATIHVSTVQKADTRVAYEDGAVGAAGKLTWQTGDCLTVVRMQGNRYVTHESDYLYEGTDGATSGEFTGTEITEAGDSWTVYYPNIVPNADGSATLPMTGQTQKEDNNTEHLRNYMLLADKGINDVYNDGFVLRMQSSIMKFSLSGDDLAKVGKLTNLVWMVETDAGPRSITLGFAPGAVTLNASKKTLTAFLSFMPQDMVVKKNGKFTVMLMGDKTYVAEITITDGKTYDAGKRYTATIDGNTTKWEEKAIMALTVKVGGSNGLGFNIPFLTDGTSPTPAKLTVDWGDGTSPTEVASGTTLTAGDGFEHTYSTAGTYTITITSDQTDETNKQIPAFNFYRYRTDNNNMTKLISIDTPLLNMEPLNFNNCFRGCTALQNIPQGLFYKNTTATAFESCFRGCTALQNIPQGLFYKNTTATAFGSCFYGCTALKEIPKGLFDENKATTSFNSCFYECTALKEIPKGLFDNNTQVTSFQSCFKKCTALKEIPQGLFDENKAATSFNSCFNFCAALQSIPKGLFNNNLDVIDFNACFDNCTHLVLHPYIFSTAGDKRRFSRQEMYFASCFLNVGSALKIGEGGTAPDLWNYEGVGNWRTVYCFAGATNLDNYTIIPKSWGGPAEDKPATP